jgi:hypothetical protein
MFSRLVIASTSALDAMLASLPVKFNPRLHNEATTQTGRFIEVGPKYQALPAQHQKEILTHEAAHFHGLDDWFLKTQEDWDLAEKCPHGSLNGQTTPGEIMAEAYSIAWHDPGFLDRVAPFLLPLLKQGCAAVKLPFPH